MKSAAEKFQSKRLKKPQFNTNQIDVSFLENGVYIIKAVSGEQQYSQRIQIQD